MLILQGLKSGKCLIAGNILFLKLYSEINKPGYLITGYNQLLNKVPQRTKAKYLCSLYTVQICKTGITLPKLAEELRHSWVCASTGRLCLPGKSVHAAGLSGALVENVIWPYAQAPQDDLGRFAEAFIAQANLDDNVTVPRLSKMTSLLAAVLNKAWKSLTITDNFPYKRDDFDHVSSNTLWNRLWSTSREIRRSNPYAIINDYWGSEQLF